MTPGRPRDIRPTKFLFGLFFRSDYLANSDNDYKVGKKG